MAARKEYGSSWWGKKWLDALSQIDDSNRIPRGKSYANTGKVKDIQIKGPTITAKVQGSQPRPYNQGLELVQFTPAQKSKVLHLIGENHHLLSVLLNRELPKELMEVLEEESIYLLPRKWKDFNTAKCSCPDYALPCKHLAAVIYMIANEIDQNPFLIFSLRGLALVDELQKMGVASTAETAELPILDLPALFNTPVTKEMLSQHQHFVQNEEAIAGIDFSELPNSQNKIAALLDDKPLFDLPENFKPVYVAQVAKISKAIQKRLSEPIVMPSGSLYEFASIENLQIEVDEEGRFASAGDFKHFLPLADRIGAIPYQQLAECAGAVRAVYFFQAAAQYLWAKGCVLPQVVRLSEKKFRIRWMPAVLVDEVKRLVNQLAQVLPPATLVMQQGKKKATVLGNEQAFALLSVFLDGFAQAFFILPNDSFRSAVQFFGLQTIDASLFTTRETPQSIQKWLQKFSFTERAFVPFLSIEEIKGKESFDMGVFAENKDDALEVPMPISKFLASPIKKHQAARTTMLRDLGLLTQYVPKISKVVQSKSETALPISLDEFVPIFMDVLPILKLMGIKVKLPKSLDRAVRPKLQGSVTATGSVGTSGQFVNMTNLLHFEWQIAIGDMQISREELIRLIKSAKKLVKIKDQYVFLDEKEMADLLKKLESPAPDGHALLRGMLAEDLDGTALILSDELRQAIEKLKETPAMPLPANLNATLRPYQQRGYEWLYKNAALGLGSLLADDMGLGKTLQTIAFMLQLKQEGRLSKEKVLVVAPTTLLGNWQREIARFAPDLSVSIFHGTNRVLDKTADVVLTSYGIARTDQKDLAKKAWAVLAIDEAQNIKNPGTAQTKAVKKIPAAYIVALSGTPVENRLSEYWSILDFVNRQFLGTLKKFVEEFAKPIEAERNQLALEKFKKMTSPFILRRLKTDKTIIQDLPDKVEQNHLCTLTPEQVSLYQNVIERSLKKLQDTEDNISRQGLVLQMITHLKQICNHPSQFLKKGLPDPSISGKATALLEILEGIVEAGEKVLIFTQYREMGDMLQKMIEEKFHQTPLWLHGGCTVKSRNEMVDTFQKKPYPKIMLLSLKAGGTGLNLTEANHVLHYDLWWNPAVEAQATDRAFRIGQKKNVMVYRFITKGTFEEKINDMIQSKRELADLAVETGETWIGNYSNDELKELFRLEV